jgi:hypothetical protein
MLGSLFALAPKQAILWGTLGLLGLIGAIAVVSPTVFAKLATRSGRWVDTNKIVQVLDKRVDIDHYVLPFSRLLGVAVIASVAVLVFVLLKYQR